MKAGVLSDTDIKRELTSKRNHDEPGLDIRPYDPTNVQPASYDLTLGTEWIVPKQKRTPGPVRHDEGLPDKDVYEIEADEFTITSMQNPELGPYDSRPFVLGHIQETIDLPDYITAEVKGRSSIGRLGVIPHTAGWVDAGFTGEVVLEFTNFSPNPITLSAGMRVAQIVFSYTNEPATEPYGTKPDSKYQGQTGVTGSRIEDDQ